MLGEHFQSELDTLKCEVEKQSQGQKDKAEQPADGVSQPKLPVEVIGGPTPLRFSGFSGRRLAKNRNRISAHQDGNVEPVFPGIEEVFDAKVFVENFCRVTVVGEDAAVGQKPDDDVTVKESDVVRTGLRTHHFADMVDRDQSRVSDLPELGRQPRLVVDGRLEQQLVDGWVPWLVLHHFEEMTSCYIWAFSPLQPTAVSWLQFR